jgi:hypothetical protein
MPLQNVRSPLRLSIQLRTTPTFVSFMQQTVGDDAGVQSCDSAVIAFYLSAQGKKLIHPKGSEFRIGVAGLMMANKFLGQVSFVLFFLFVFLSPDLLFY